MNIISIICVIPFGLIHSTGVSDSFELFTDLMDVNYPTQPALSVDWCFEYDELRFRIDALTVSIDAWKIHRDLLASTVVNTTRFVNDFFLAPIGIRLDSNNIGPFASGAKIPQEKWTHVESLLAHLKEPLAGIDRSLEDKVTAVMYPNPPLYIAETPSYYALLIVGIKMLSDRANRYIAEFETNLAGLMDFVTSRRIEIENCWEERKQESRLVVEKMKSRHDLEIRLYEKFSTVRDIITGAILEHSVSRSLQPIPADFKILCVASVRSLMREEFDPNRFSSKIPVMLKKSLKQQSWGFLITWLEVFDDMREKWLKKHQENIKRIGKIILNFEENFSIAQDMLNHLKMNANNTSM